MKSQRSILKIPIYSRLFLLIPMQSFYFWKFLKFCDPSADSLENWQGCIEYAPCSCGLTWHHHPAPVDVETRSHSRKKKKQTERNKGDERLTGRIKGERRKETEADKEEVCGWDTDPAVTAARSTTTRGSGFFCVSLEWGRKVGEDFKSEKGESGHCRAQTVAERSPNHAKHLQSLC